VLDSPNRVPQNGPSETGSGPDDVEILSEILAAFKKLQPESQKRMLDTVATFLGMAVRPADSILSAPHHGGSSGLVEAPFSEDRSPSAKEFCLEKQPQTDIERVACLAYYLTHYRDTPHFKTLDISKLNTEAAQAKFSNPTVAVDNATKRNYLVAASKGNKQLSATGEQFVLALPDREKARAIMANARPRRRARKIADDGAEDQQ